MIFGGTHAVPRPAAAVRRHPAPDFVFQTVTLSSCHLVILSLRVSVPDFVLRTLKRILSQPRLSALEKVVIFGTITAMIMPSEAFSYDNRYGHYNPGASAEVVVGRRSAAVAADRPAGIGEHGAARAPDRLAGLFRARGAAVR